MAGFKQFVQSKVHVYSDQQKLVITIEWVSCETVAETSWSITSSEVYRRTAKLQHPAAHPGVDRPQHDALVVYGPKRRSLIPQLPVQSRRASRSTRPTRISRTGSIVLKMERARQERGIYITRRYWQFKSVKDWVYLEALELQAMTWMKEKSSEIQY